MTITLEISPEVQAALAGQAAALGRGIEAYVTSLLEEVAYVSRSRELAYKPSEAENLFDLFAPVRGLLTDEEIDRSFSRSPSTSRPVDLA